MHSLHSHSDVYPPYSYYSSYPYPTVGRKQRRLRPWVWALAFLVAFILLFSRRGSSGSSTTTSSSGHRLHRRPVHHAPFTPPDVGTVVHGKIVDQLPEFVNPPRPFPYSPQAPAYWGGGGGGRGDGVDFDGGRYDGADSRPWLAAVICAASDTERRMMIRSTWMQLYHDVPFDGRFVVSNPGEWTDVVVKENRTYGDMIVLDRLAEDDITANTVKTLEFYKWLVESGRRYEFVSKMDTDLWLNARLFWEKYLRPNLVTDATGSLVRAAIDHTVIGELYYARTWDLVFAHGSMYTVTWDMVELLTKLQDRYQVVTGEDMAVATLLLRGRQTANFINFRGSEKFDYDDRDTRGDGTAWARDATHPNAITHAIASPDTIAIHNLKHVRNWVKVAACFNEAGIKPRPPASRPDRTPLSLQWRDFWASWGWPSNAQKTRFGQIPDFLWSFQDGSWVCDGIWKMGKTKSGHLGSQ